MNSLSGMVTSLTPSLWECQKIWTSLLQIPADRHRCHYIKVKVRVHRYVSGHLALFHGPRKLADYDEKGKVISQKLKRLPTDDIQADNSCASEPDKSKSSQSRPR
ncbi:MAG: hypothetical protein SCG77_02750 [Nitrosomonadaceae bacterium]|nr:hypothetical protein [Nitrosomonadaceae bacterium]